MKVPWSLMKSRACSFPMSAFPNLCFLGRCSHKPASLILHLPQRRQLSVPAKVYLTQNPQEDWPFSANWWACRAQGKEFWYELFINTKSHTNIIYSGGVYPVITKCNPLQHGRLKLRSAINCYCTSVLFQSLVFNVEFTKYYNQWPTGKISMDLSTGWRGLRWN